MKAKDYRAFKKAVSGFLTTNDVKPGCHSPIDGENTTDAHFSKSPCECCKRPLAGSRETYSFAINQCRSGTWTFEADICPDCVYFLTYDALDDASMLEVEKTRYEEMGNDDFERILTEIVGKLSAGTILSYGGVREILGEAFNNDVIARWAIENPL